MEAARINNSVLCLILERRLSGGSTMDEQAPKCTKRNERTGTGSESKEQMFETN